MEGACSYHLPCPISTVISALSPVLRRWFQLTPQVWRRWIEHDEHRAPHGSTYLVVSDPNGPKFGILVCLPHAAKGWLSLHSMQAGSILYPGCFLDPASILPEWRRFLSPRLVMQHRVLAWTQLMVQQSHSGVIPMVAGWNELCDEFHIWDRQRRAGEVVYLEEHFQCSLDERRLRRRREYP